VANTSPSKETSSAAHLKLLADITVGTRIGVYWPDDDQYYPCTISAHRPKRGKDTGHRYELLYDDGGIETIDLSNERFRLLRGHNKNKKNVRDDSDDAAEGGPNGNKHASVVKRAMGGGHPKKLGDIVEEASSPARDIVEEASVPAGDIVEDALAPAGDIVEEASAPTVDIVEEASAPAGDIVEEALAPVVATGKGRKRKGRKLPFTQALHPSVIIEDGGRTQSVQACTVQCTWSFFAPCSAKLPPPVTCNKCSALVHHVCQINWEDKHSYEPPGCSKYCPSHHEYCQEITAAGGGESLQHNHFITSRGHCMCQGGTEAVLPKHSCSTEGATIIRGIKSQWHKHISRGIHINTSNDHQ
jgi:hypothetical protein